MLRQATKLEDLYLSFLHAVKAIDTPSRYLFDRLTRKPAKSIFHIYEDEERVPARLSWSPNFRRLVLNGFICTNNQLRSVLSQCAASLRYLTLHDLLLMPDSFADNRVCLVSFLDSYEMISGTWYPL